MATGAGALLMVLGGGVAGVVALTQGDAKPRIVTTIGDPVPPGYIAPDDPLWERPLPVPVAEPGGTPSPVDPAATDSSRAGSSVTGSSATGSSVTGSSVAGPATAGNRARAGQAGAARTATGPAGAGPMTGHYPARPPATAGQGPVPATVKASPNPVAPATKPAQPAAQPAVRDVITTRTEMVNREIPFTTRTVSDPRLPFGSKRVRTPGVPGVETLRYLVTLTNGKPTGRRLVSTTVTRRPQQEVIAVGEDDDDCDDPFDLCDLWGHDLICRHHRREFRSLATESTQPGESGLASASAQVDAGAQVSALGQVNDDAQAGTGGQIGVGGNDLTPLGGGHAGGEGRGAGC